MSRLVVLLALSATGAGLLCGCAQGLETLGYSTQVIASSEPEAVLRAAQVVLRREFPRMTVDRRRGRIACLPVEYSTPRGSGTARDLVGVRSRMRRVAELAVLRHGERTLARLRIDVEREDTARGQNAPRQTYRLSDSPAYTPIERLAATSEQQNTVWTRVRRDRRLERALLTELSERFAPPAPGGSAPASAPAAGGD